MGQAKNRKAEIEALKLQGSLVPQHIIDDVSAKIKAKCDVLGTLGMCIPIAALAANLLREHGIVCEVTGGYAGFSITNKMMDVLVWDARCKKDPMVQGAECHFWVRTEKQILDFSAMNFDATLQQMSEADGHITNGTWGRDVNVLNVRDAMKDFKHFVRNNLRPGAMYYDDRNFTCSTVREKFGAWFS